MFAFLGTPAGITLLSILGIGASIAGYTYVDKRTVDVNKPAPPKQDSTAALLERNGFTIAIICIAIIYLVSKK